MEQADGDDQNQTNEDKKRRLIVYCGGVVIGKSNGNLHDNGRNGDVRAFSQEINNGKIDPKVGNCEIQVVKW